MKFILTSKNLFWWPVIVQAPDPETPGKFIEQRLEIRFDVPDQADEVAYQEKYAAAKTQRERVEMEMHRLLGVISDWRGVEDEARKDVPFSAEIVTAALQQPWFRAGVYKALAESISGKEARLGN